MDAVILAVLIIIMGLLAACMAGIFAIYASKQQD
jgi:thiol:disulfide interchange protein